MSSRALVRIPYSLVFAVWLLLSTGCIELALAGAAVDEGEDESEEPYCGYSTPQAEPPSAAFAGGARSHRAGQLGRGRLDVSLDEDTVADLEAVEVTMIVKTGQALPGQALELTLDDRRLQSAPITGPFVNEARFQVSVMTEQCPAPCVLRFYVSGPSLDLDVPVPIEVEGTVSLRIREKPSHCPVPPRVAIYDAELETRDAG